MYIFFLRRSCLILFDFYSIWVVEWLYYLPRSGCLDSNSELPPTYQHKVCILTASASGCSILFPNVLPPCHPMSGSNKPNFRLAESISQMAQHLLLCSQAVPIYLGLHGMVATPGTLPCKERPRLVKSFA